MKIITFIPFLIFLFLFQINSIQGQILKKLKNKVQQAAEESVLNKLGEKVYQKTDKQMDSLLNIDPNYQSQTNEKLGKLLEGSNIPVADQYRFDTRVIYDLETTHKKEKTTMENTFWLSNSGQYFGSAIKMNEVKQEGELPEIFTILDEEHEAILIFMEEQKIVQTMSMKSISDLVEEDESIDQTINIKQTGNTKTILGYTCEEFVSETPDAKTTMWITQDLELFKKNMFYNLNKSLGGNKLIIPEAAKGMMMEMTMVGLSKDTQGDITKMTVRQIDAKEKAIDLKNYQKMNLGNMMNR
ncbi:DUF4412 domain-containing protein [Namhaeicola litoreus]|uniref:DUF4412 domain-containing protein n=1 Tax=Namhaeicola litoreus TaxID=1052145 RepID=A0ABW3Y0X6_9FLAO